MTISTNEGFTATDYKHLEITPNGTVLPNRFLKWRQIPINRPTPLLDGTEYINEENWRIHG